MTRVRLRVTPAQTGAGIVALVAGYASYRHIFHVARLAGEPFSVAAAYPFATDGLIIVATAVLFDRTRTGWGKFVGRAGLAAGVGATLAYNILSTRPDLVAMPEVRAAVAAWPAVAFLLAIEILTTGRRRGPQSTPAPDMSASDPDTSGVPDSVPDVFPARPDGVPASGVTPPGRWRRGAVRQAVIAHAVEHCPSTDPEHIRAYLGAGSVRHIRRVLRTLTPESTREQVPA